MEKYELVTNYIFRCDEILEGLLDFPAKDLVSEIVAVFQNEISNIATELPAFRFGGTENHMKDLIILKAILINYSANLKREDEIRKNDLEKLKLQQSIMTINNTNHNEASTEANVNVTVVVTVNQAIESINSLPNDVLSKEEKESLEEKVASLELLTKSGDKEKASKKLGSILKYVADKGIEVGIALLPYLGEISKLLQGN
jgi:hypothetical protein